MEIRYADLADAVPISEFIIYMTQKYVLPSCEPHGHELLINSMAAPCIKAYMESGYVYYVATESSGVIVGVIAIKENSHIYHLFVKDSHFGQGIARQLWETAQSDCLSKGNPGQFSVLSSVNAENVYQHFGFKRVDGIHNRHGIRIVPMELLLP